MKKEIELIEFNLTYGMSKELIKFNNIQKQLLKLKNKKNLNNKELIQIEQLEAKLKSVRIKFIKQFRENNKEEINKYLEMKDQL